MSCTDFVALCGRVECLSAKVTHQLIRAYPALHKFSQELSSFQSELVEVIDNLPDEKEEGISRKQRRLLEYNTRCYEGMEREFSRLCRPPAQEARGGARRVP